MSLREKIRLVIIRKISINQRGKLYRFILQGPPSEQTVITDELTRSARTPAGHATDRRGLKYHRNNREQLSDLNQPAQLH